MGLHVLAIDYRGYGDSSWVSPSQTSMVEDAKVALEWLQNHSQSDAQLFVWGHSLGTGVTSKLCSLLCLEKESTPRKVDLHLSH